MLIGVRAARFNYRISALIQVIHESIAGLLVKWRISSGSISCPRGLTIVAEHAQNSSKSAAIDIVLTTVLFRASNGNSCRSGKVGDFVSRTATCLRLEAVGHCRSTSCINSAPVAISRDAADCKNWKNPFLAQCCAELARGWRKTYSRFCIFSIDGNEF